MFPHNVYFNIIILFNSSLTVARCSLQHVLVHPVLTTSDWFVLIGFLYQTLCYMYDVIRCLLRFVLWGMFDR